MTNLNLARKWRSKTFDELVGQELSRRILKNTLYLNHFFPVYLFHGQRGCGKTTTARIFASAVNCQRLKDFQKDPTLSIPCLSCQSCTAMATGSHPDFIEIDGASHTGVDNIRSLIDAALLLPVLGHKKIYLIDEAHMLSKAAFNAFLKMLEEPPASVSFILATTELQKIIDTVKSRCFQLFFPALKVNELTNHLAHICTQENIAYDQLGLSTIAQESDGSVRDALNLLEQLRFSGAAVTKNAVLMLLGSCDDQTLFLALDYCIDANIDKLLTLLKQQSNTNAESLWYNFTRLLGDIIALKHNLNAQYFGQYHDKLTAYAHKLSLVHLKTYLEYFYVHEFQFQKTKYKDLFIMNAFIQLCSPSPTHNIHTPSLQENQSNPVSVPEPAINETPSTPIIAAVPEQESWTIFLQEIKKLHDPLLESIFSQAQCKQCDSRHAEVIICYPQDFEFFQDLLIKAEYSWKPLLEKIIGKAPQLIIKFDQQKENQRAMPTSVPVTASIKQDVLPKKVAPAEQAPQKNVQTYKADYPKKIKKTQLVDVSNKEKWKFASLIVELFPGTVTVHEGSHE